MISSTNITVAVTILSPAVIQTFDQIFYGGDEVLSPLGYVKRQSWEYATVRFVINFFFGF